MSTDIQEIQTQLEEERGRLEGEIATLERESEEAVRPATSGLGHEQAPDEASAAQEQERVHSVVQTLRYELDEVEAALERIAGGTYGLCADCGQPISPERLQALPQATLCVPCKSRRERAH